MNIWNSREYGTWERMRDRCYNPNHHKYHRYGGRGITICDRWLQSFKNFYADMGPKPEWAHSIDRIDNNGNYEPSNCRWATREEQDNNTSRNVFVECENERLTVTQWARRMGTDRERMRKWIAKGNRPIDFIPPAPKEKLPPISKAPKIYPGIPISVVPCTCYSENPDWKAHRAECKRWKVAHARTKKGQPLEGWVLKSTTGFHDADQTRTGNKQLPNEAYIIVSSKTTGKLIKRLKNHTPANEIPCTCSKELELNRKLEWNEHKSYCHRRKTGWARMKANGTCETPKFLAKQKVQNCETEGKSQTNGSNLKVRSETGRKS